MSILTTMLLADAVSKGGPGSGPKRGKSAELQRAANAARNERALERLRELKAQGKHPMGGPRGVTIGSEYYPPSLAVSKGGPGSGPQRGKSPSGAEIKSVEASRRTRIANREPTIAHHLEAAEAHHEAAMLFSHSSKSDDHHMAMGHQNSSDKHLAAAKKLRSKK